MSKKIISRERILLSRDVYHQRLILVSIILIEISRFLPASFQREYEHKCQVAKGGRYFVKDQHWGLYNNYYDLGVVVIVFQLYLLFETVQSVRTQIYIVKQAMKNVMYILQQRLEIAPLDNSTALVISCPSLRYYE